MAVVMADDVFILIGTNKRSAKLSLAHLVDKRNVGQIGRGPVLSFHLFVDAAIFLHEFLSDPLWRIGPESSRDDHIQFPIPLRNWSNQNHLVRTQSANLASQLCPVCLELTVSLGEYHDIGSHSNDGLTGKLVRARTG